MLVGDLVIEKTRMNRRPSLGILLHICEDRIKQEMPFPYFIHWFDDGAQEWTRELFFEVIE